MWYGLYNKCKSYSANNLTSTMIWGSQYDAMMNWMAKTGKTVGWGAMDKYNKSTATGSKSTDIINNVYDLYGCHRDWTLEAYYAGYRAFRGGHYDLSMSPAARSSNWTGNEYDRIHYSSRLALYINL